MSTICVSYESIYLVFVKEADDNLLKPTHDPLRLCISKEYVPKIVTNLLPTSSFGPILVHALPYCELILCNPN